MNFLLFASEAAGGHENGFWIGRLDEVMVAAVASIIIFILLYWKGAGPAKKMLSDRSDRIAKEIDDAEKAHADAQGKLDDVQGRIANAENERQRILVEARQTAEALKTQIVAKADDEAEALKVRAAADIESSKAQAIADLQAEVGALALGAAEAVIAANRDAPTQSQLIDAYIDQVGAA
jgi:F-type H+-transporting ATPase subunit b